MIAANYPALVTQQQALQASGIPRRAWNKKKQMGLLPEVIHKGCKQPKYDLVKVLEMATNPHNHPQNEFEQ